MHDMFCRVLQDSLACLHERQTQGESPFLWKRLYRGSTESQAQLVACTEVQLPPASGGNGLCCVRCH